MRAALSTARDGGVGLTRLVQTVEADASADKDVKRLVEEVIAKDLLKVEAVRTQRGFPFAVVTCGEGAELVGKMREQRRRCMGESPLLRPFSHGFAPTERRQADEPSRPARSLTYIPKEMVDLHWERLTAPFVSPYFRKTR